MTDGSRAGSDEEFKDFVLSRWPDLVRYAYLLVGDVQHAEDVVQVALENTWRRWRRARLERPESYVRVAIARQAISRHRRLRRRVPEWPAGEHLPDPGATPPGGGTDEAYALREVVRQELAQLPPRMRAVVVLRVWEDLGERETADILGCSLGAVKSQLSRGLERLRRQPLLRDAVGLEPFLLPRRAFRGVVDDAAE